MANRVLLSIVAAVSLAALQTPAGRAQVRNDSFRVLTVHSPPEIARTDTIRGQDINWAGQPPDEGVTARMTLVQDVMGTNEGCSPLVNGDELAGSIALFARGTCNFMTKAQRAYRNRALAWLVFNHDLNPEEGDSTFIIMAMPDTARPFLPIPGGFLARYIRDAILPTMLSRVPVTATLAPYFDTPNPATEGGAAPDGMSLTVVPNPARRTTTLTLRLLTAAHVRIEASDALGRGLGRLHDGVLPAGTHRLAWGTGELPPGTYLLRATSEREIVTRTVVLAR